jgi:hypothetical protein
MFDKRRELMDAWAAYCTKPTQAEQNNVATMTRVLPA